MPDFSIAQAVFDGTDIIASSANFLEVWIPEAHRLVEGFGICPSGIECPKAVFAQRFGSKHVAIVQVVGPPVFPTLRFHFLVMARNLYAFLHDPFAIADRYPWSGEKPRDLDPLEWPHEVLPPRTIAQLDKVLKDGDGPFLLGGSQTLVDGGKILLQNAVPQPELIRDLWSLLPESTRRSLWPTTFAFSADLGFDILIMPAIPDKGIPGYLSDQQVRDYPDSRYERQLQHAIESGNSAELERLLARKTTSEMIRLVIWLVFGLVAFSIGSRLILR